MKSYYYFVRDMSCPSRQTIIYHVAVGTSDREQVKFALVREYCRDCGLFFRPVSKSSDIAVSNLVKSLFPGSSWFVSPLRHATISITELYALIVDDSFASFEASFTEKKGSYNFRRSINYVLFCKDNRKKVHPLLLTHPRKYLKSESEPGLDSFLISSLVIAAIFLLAGFLEGRFVYGL